MCVFFVCFFLSCVCYVFVRVCLYVLCGLLLGKGWPLGSRLWCLTVNLSLPIGILGQVWYLIVSIPDLCTLTYFYFMRRETSLSPPVKYFTDRSKAVLLLWIFYVFLSCVFYAFVRACVCYVFVRVCLYVLCGHLLGKGWPLGSFLWCLTVSLSLSHWYPGSGLVLDYRIPDLCTLTYF